MTLLLIATVLLGLMLGQFFKVYVLIPTCCVVLALAFAGSTLGYDSLTYSLVDFVLIMASLQIGYFVSFALNLSANPDQESGCVTPNRSRQGCSVSVKDRRSH
jgi:hypothetical protein